MNEITNALYVVAGVILVVGLAMFLRSPAGKKAVTTVETDWAAIHTKLDELLVRAKLTHDAALAPVTVALVSAQPLSVPAPKPDVAPSPFPANTTDPAAPGFVMPTTLAPAPAAAPPDPVIDFSAPTLDFNVICNQDMIFQGPVAKTVVNCPASVMVKAIQPSNAPLLTPYWLTVNGVKRQVDNPNEGVMVTVAGPEINVSVDQQAGSSIDLHVQQGA